MLRDFSQEKKDELEGMLQTTDMDFLDFLGDRFGDYIQQFEHWIGILSLEHYTGTVSQYQEKMLDINNVTKRELQEIFDAVYELDSEYGPKFAELAREQEKYAAMMEILISMIHPNFSIKAVAAIDRSCESVKKELKNIKEQINASYEAELDEAVRREALEAVKGMGVNALSGLSSIYEFTGKLALQDYKGAASSAWDLINAPFKTGQSAVALGALALGIGFGKLGGKGKYRQYEYAVAEAEDYNTRSGLTSELKGASTKNGDFFDKAGNVSGTVDTVQSMYEVYDTADGFFKEPQKTKKRLTKAEKLAKNASQEKALLSAGKNILKGTLDFIAPEEGYLFEKNPLTSLGKDAYDAVGDILESVPVVN